MSDGKKIHINEGTIKKGNTSPPPAKSRPPAPAGQAPKGSAGGGAVMTENKPKVVAYHINKDNPEHKGVTLEPLVRLSDYEALQAECEKLRKDAERYQWLRDAAGRAV